MNTEHEPLRVPCGWLISVMGTEIPVQVIEKQPDRVLIEAFQDTPISWTATILEPQERIWVPTQRISSYFTAFLEPMRSVEHEA